MQLLLEGHRPRRIFFGEYQWLHWAWCVYYKKKIEGEFYAATSCFNKKDQSSSSSNRAELSTIPAPELSSPFFPPVMHLPAYGGNMLHNGYQLYFQNICPLDSWMALLRLVFHLDTDTYSHMERLCPHPDLSPILSFIKQEQYCSAKLRFSRLNNVGISKKGVLDFFGSGYENLLIHILPYINRWMQESKCSSAALPK